MKPATLCRWVFVLFLLSGCMFDPPTMGIPSENIEIGQREYLALLKASGNFKISEEELESQITQLLNNGEFYGRSAAPGAKTVITSSSKLPVSVQNMVRQLAYARSTTTGENGEPSVEIYVFNTEDTEGTEGYVLASNDMRLGIVLAVVDGGSLEDEPEWWNNIIFEGISNYIDYIVDLYNNIGDEEIQQILQNPVLMSEGRSTYSGSGSKSNINGKGLIHHWYPDAANVRQATWSWTEGYEARTDSAGVRVLTNWHQDFPYNYYVCGSEASAFVNDYVTGCGPVAMAQLMAIWGKPTNSKNSDFIYNWAIMRRDFSDSSSLGALSVAYLMHELGKHTSSKYTKRKGGDGASTGTTDSNLIKGLKTMGYKTPTGFSTYSFSTVKSSIIAGRPVIAGGYSQQKTFLGIPTGYENGHYWLVDGVRKMTYKEILVDGASWTWDNWDFVYCNAGWGAVRRYNAWYASGIFDCRTGLQSYVSRSSDKDYYYQYKLQILPDVYY